LNTCAISLAIDKFICGDQDDLQAANRLEVLIDDEFPDDDFLQETVEALACYRPEGGEFVMDIAAMRERLAKTKIYLQALRK
jgi:hypothetical protein